MAPRITFKAGFVSLFLAAAAVGHAAINLVIVNKEAFFYQGGPSVEDVTLSDGYGILAEVLADNQSDASNVSVRLPGGEFVSMPWDTDEPSYFVEESGFSSSSALNSEHPAGDYVVTFTPSGGSQVSKTLTLGNSFPNAPMVENWFDLRHFPVNQDMVVRWAPMTNGAAKDVINPEVFDRTSQDLVFETGVHYLGDPDALDGTDTSVTIPAGTLEIGKDYEFRLGFNQIDDIDIGQTLPNVLMAAIHYTETNMELVPVTRHPSTVIDWGVVGRWTKYIQIDSNFLAPLPEDYFGAVRAIVKTENVNDLNSVALNGVHQLASNADAGGWIWEEPVSGVDEFQSYLPNGTVTLDWGFSAGGSHTTRLELQGESLSPIRISNWAELQSFDATKVGSIEWTAPESWRDFDIFFIGIEDENGNRVFESTIDLDSAAMLRGDDRLLSLPAGTLEAGKAYRAWIEFIQVTDLDANSQAGAFFAAVNAVETIFTINTGAAANDPVAVGAIGREVYYLQTGPGAPVLALQDDEQFGALAILLGDSVHELTSASVTLPGGTVAPLFYESEDSEYGLFATHASFDALIAAFPAGDYTLRYEITGGAQVQNTLTLGEVFPGVPHVSNWSATQSVNASEDFTITWDPIDEMSETDGIAIYIDDPMGDSDLFVREVRLIDPSGLLGTAQSVTIPAGTLQPDRTYEVTIDALNFTEIDESNEGQVFVAFNMSSTGFNLSTSGGNQPPVIVTASLDDAEEGKAYTFDVMATDGEGGSAASMELLVKPSWLEFTDLGNGSLRLSGTPTGSNVGVFTVKVSATDSEGLTASRNYDLTVKPDLSDPEGRSLDIMGINWQRDGQSPFLPQIDVVQKGESALISGGVGDGGTSFLEASFTGPLKLSFFWRVSSENGKDFFRVRVDGDTAAEISGNKNWREMIVDVPDGVHTVRWAYEKDGSGSAGADRGWVDHVTILPAESGVYAGTYLGDIASSTGEVSLYVRPNNTAVFLGYHPESGKSLSNFSFSISNLGTFRFEVVDPENTSSNYTVTGSIDSGVATGTVSGLNLTFGAALVSGGGQLVTYDGYYQNALAATTTGLVYLIVASDGQAYFYAQDADYIEGFITTIDQAGKIILKTQEGFDYDLQIDPSTDIVSGTYTPPGGEASGVLGIREGSPGDELLANISTRGKVLTGGKVMIASFVIAGNGSKSLLIRAIGPRLADFGVEGVLPDPVIELIRLGEDVPMFVNNDWGDGGQGTTIVEDSIRVGAFGLNAGGLDSVMSVSLEPGAYTAKVRGSGDLTGVGLVEVYDADDTTERLSTADVVNIATRGEVGTGGDILIAGFVVSGEVPKRILLRAVGPQLGVYGVQDTLVDPRIDLVDSENVVVGSNNDWGLNPDVAAVVSASQEVGAFPLDAGSKDAALLIWLEPGAYTVQVSGADGGTGVALIEVYDN